LVRVASRGAEATARSVAVPPERQVAVAVASGAKSVKVKSAPAGVTVAGAVKKGRLAVAVVRPRGVAASGWVVFTVGGRTKGVKTFPDALGGGRAPGCAGLGMLLSKRLKGTADMKALAPVLAAKLCGKPAPGNAAAVLAKLGLGAAPPAPPAPPAGGTLTRPSTLAKPVPTATPKPGGTSRPCDDDLDNDGDGQTDWEDPGCSDAGDQTENSEVPVSAACAQTAGVGLNGDDPAELGAGVNGDCGDFYEVTIQVAPGVESCSANNGFECQVFDPVASASVDEHHPTDMVDVSLRLKGPVDCAKQYTMAFYRENGEVAELQAPVANCKTLPPAPPKCANGKDDDGDGMVDAQAFGAAGDPDPGCSDASDMSEDSEIAAPESCEIAIGVWDNDLQLPGAQADGCGVLKGFWFHPAGTPSECGYAFADDEETTACAVNGLTGGQVFPALTGLTPLKVVVPTTADIDCRLMTLALLKEDGKVWFKRQKMGGC
jgi:hypothetical protein